MADYMYDLFGITCECCRKKLREIQLLDVSRPPKNGCIGMHSITDYTQIAPIYNQRLEKKKKVRYQLKSE